MNCGYEQARSLSLNFSMHKHFILELQSATRDALLHNIFSRAIAFAIAVVLIVSNWKNIWLIQVVQVHEGGVFNSYKRPK